MEEVVVVPVAGKENTDREAGLECALGGAVDVRVALLQDDTQGAAERPPRPVQQQPRLRRSQTSSQSARWSSATQSGRFEAYRAGSRAARQPLSLQHAVELELVDTMMAVLIGPFLVTIEASHTRAV